MNTGNSRGTALPCAFGCQRTTATARGPLGGFVVRNCAVADWARLSNATVVTNAAVSCNLYNRRTLLLLFRTDAIMTLDASDSAPDFSVPDQDGKIVRLKDFKGQAVVLFFFPKADTPG